MGVSYSNTSDSTSCLSFARPAPGTDGIPLFIEYLREPYTSFARLHEYPDPYWDDFASIWYVSRFENVQHLLKSPVCEKPSISSTICELPSQEREIVEPVAEFYAQWLVFSDGEVHKFLRREFLKYFKESEIRQLSTQIKDWTVKQAEEFRRSPQDLIEDFAQPLAARCMELVFGVSGELTRELTELAYELIEYPTSYISYLEAAPAAQAAINRLDEEIADPLLQSASGWLTKPLAQIFNEGQINRLTTCATIAQFLTGTVAPTTAALTIALHQTSRDDRTVSALAEGTLPVDRVTQEALRFDSPFHFAPRTVAQSFSLGDTTFARGDHVDLVVAAANHDPTRWEAPEVFKPDRPYLPNLSFGRGSHSCLGAALARLQINTALTVASDMKLFDLMTGDLERVPRRGASSFKTVRSRGLPQTPNRF